HTHTHTHTLIYLYRVERYTVSQTSLSNLLFLTLALSPTHTHTHTHTHIFSSSLCICYHSPPVLPPADWKQKRQKASEAVSLECYRGLAEVAIRCLCELLVALPHFNFHNNIMVVVVPHMNEQARQVRAHPGAGEMVVGLSGETREMVVVGL